MLDDIVCRPVFLPNPSDGSLYTFDIVEGVKKLPFTIPDLVNTAPCRSSDGRLLYTGSRCILFILPNQHCYMHILACEVPAVLKLWQS